MRRRQAQLSMISVGGLLSLKNRCCSSLQRRSCPQPKAEMSLVGGASFASTSNSATRTSLRGYHHYYNGNNSTASLFTPNKALFAGGGGAFRPTHRLLFPLHSESLSGSTGVSGGIEGADPLAHHMHQHSNTECSGDASSSPSSSSSAAAPCSSSSVASLPPHHAIPPKTFEEPMASTHAAIHNEYLGFFFRTVEWKPHPDKAITGGEDSFLATDYALGVADGVGWWDQLDDEDKKVSKMAGKGEVLPAEPATELKRSAAQQYSETFMRAAFDFCEEEYLGQGEVPVDKLAEYAYEHSKQCKKGSCTVTFGTIVNNHLQVYNMGDCVLLLVRCGRVIFRTEEKSHGLNFPFQLGVGSKDLPQDGEVSTIKIRRGDVIVIGSDGIFDNVFEEDIIHILKKHDEKNLSEQIRMLGLVDSEAQYEHILMHERRSASSRALAGTHAQEILKAAAKEIIELATANTNDPRANTPFATKCLESGAYHEGGKPDDMTLVMTSVASSLMSEGVRFGTSDFGEVPVPYKNWPASTQYID